MMPTVSVAVMTAVWLAASAVAGPVLGLLGYAVRVAARWRAALACGAACGLFTGEGWWWAIWTGPPGQVVTWSNFAAARGIGDLVRIGLPIAVLIWLATAHRLWRAWPALLPATAAAAAAGTLAWWLIHRL
jgi:hypothetical protein